MTTKLDYTSGKTIIPEGAFGISPSGLHTFISAPHMWYRENVLGEKTFTGNTATVLGTIVHFVAEEFMTKQNVDRDEVMCYIAQQTCLKVDLSGFRDLSFEAKIEFINKHKNNPEIDASVILDQWKPRGQSLIDFLNKKQYVNYEVEQMISREILPGYFACGSADAIYLNNRGKYTLRDYKTTSDTTPKKNIPMNYRYQLLTYAWIFKGLGYDVDSIEIVWNTPHDIDRYSDVTHKKLKDYPSVTESVVELIYARDFEFIEDILKLVAETTQAAKDNPKLLHCLFKDYRLKQE